MDAPKLAFTLFGDKIHALAGEKDFYCGSPLAFLTSVQPVHQPDFVLGADGNCRNCERAVKAAMKKEGIES